jgi:hypothetical protein
MDAAAIGSVSSLFTSWLPTGAASPQPAIPGRHDCGSCDSHKARASDDSTATLRYRRSERTALYIQTQEGDVVRLRIKVRDSATATGSGGNGGDTPVAELSVNARSSVKISFHVDGNLNADELAAIQDVAAQVGALADEFFAGDVPAAFAAAQNLNIDGSQLAKVGLRLSQHQSVTYRGPALAPPAAAEQPAPAALPAPAETTPVVADPAPAAPAEAEAVPDPAATEAPVEAAETAAPAAGTSDEAAPPAADAAPAASPAPAPTSVAGSVLATIGDFLHQLLAALGAPAESTDGATQASLSLSLKLRLFAVAVVNVAAAVPAEPAATDNTDTPASTDNGDRSAAPLLADTLDALAAAHEPPLSTTA